MAKAATKIDKIAAQAAKPKIVRLKGKYSEIDLKATGKLPSWEDQDKLQALSSGRTADVQASTQQRGQDIQLQIGKMQAAATAAAREMGADNKAITAAEAAFARDPEAAAIKKRLENPILANNPAKAAVDLQRLREIQASKYKQFGITLEGAPSAAGPSGTSLKYNPKTGKIE